MSNPYVAIEELDLCCWLNNGHDVREVGLEPVTEVFDAFIKFIEEADVNNGLSSIELPETWDVEPPHTMQLNQDGTVTLNNNSETDNLVFQLDFLRNVAVPTMKALIACQDKPGGATYVSLQNELMPTGLDVQVTPKLFKVQQA